VYPAIPLIEISNHADTFSGGCPDGKQGAFNPVNLMGMGTQQPIGMLESAFIEEVQVKITELGAKAIGVINTMAIALTISQFKLIGGADLVGRACPFEEVRTGDAGQLGATDNAHFLHQWVEDRDPGLIVIAQMPAQDAKWVMVTCFNNTLQIFI
jgi:hypothetical protein